MHLPRLDRRPAWTVTCRHRSDKPPEEPHNEENYEENIKEKILEASLRYVPTLGWSKNALSSGAESVGYPSVTHGMFPKGAGDLVHYFQRSSNKKLVEYLKQVCVHT